MSDPKELKYSKTHEWLRVIDEETVELGITEYAINLLTDITYIELPDEGDSFSAGDSFGEIESVKAASELYCPVNGEVVEVNTALDSVEGLEAMTKEPYTNGWMIRLKLEGENDLSGMMSYDEYQEHTKKES